MKVTFLGTGAADFSPLLDTEYLHKLGKDHRRSSAILMEEQYLVDCGPHVLNSMEIQGVEIGKITDLFLTHFHDDHCDWDVIRMLASVLEHPLRIWFREGGEVPPVKNAQFISLKPGQTVKSGRMKITALAANHSEWPLHFDFELGKVKLFYGCDGAWLLNDTFYAMWGRQYNCMILDATVGDYNGDWRIGEHNSIPMIRLMTASFPEKKVLAPEGQIWMSHIARTLHQSHDQIVEQLKKDGYFVAYDGMTLEIT